jgi:hypothetical protein
MGRLLPKSSFYVMTDCSSAVGHKKIEVAKKAAGPIEKRKHQLQQPPLKLRKHPLAPKKPRSAFILFSQYMHNESSALVEHIGEEKVEKDNKVRKVGNSFLAKYLFDNNPHDFLFPSEHHLGTHTGSSSSQAHFSGMEGYVF